MQNVANLEIFQAVALEINRASHLEIWQETPLECGRIGARLGLKERLRESRSGSPGFSGLCSHFVLKKTAGQQRNFWKSETGLFCSPESPSDRILLSL